MQRASTLENSSFNVVLLIYLWRMTAVLGHYKSICLTVKWHVQWSLTGWLSLDRIYEWFIRLWPILSRVRTVSSRRHNDACGLFLPSTGLIENSLFVGVLSHESCHSSMHSFDICGKKALWRNLALSDDRTNTFFGCLICHFVSFYPNMARNPAQADTFAHISQLGVELKYVEDCNVDNIEALDCL